MIFKLFSETFELYHKMKYLGNMYKITFNVSHYHNTYIFCFIIISVDVTNMKREKYISYILYKCVHNHSIWFVCNFNLLLLLLLLFGLYYIIHTFHCFHLCVTIQPSPAILLAWIQYISRYHINFHWKFSFYPLQYKIIIKGV